MREETCDKCGREAYTLESDGTLVCRVHQSQESREMVYECTKSGCNQPPTPSTYETTNRCIFHKED